MTTPDGRSVVPDSHPDSSPSSGAPRVRLRREDRRAQLIEIGVQMLSTRTMDELSVDEIAAAANISRGLLFHYFDSKADFQLAVTRAAADNLLFTTQPDLTLGAAAQLEHSLRAYIHYVVNNRSSYLSLVRGAAGANVEMQAVFDQTRNALAQRVTDRWIRNGVRVDSLQELAIRGWVAFVEDVAVGWLTDHEDDVELDDLLALLRDQLLFILRVRQ